ncbi:hypothetical protein GCM10009545_03010 [Saccharopolyspora thermophila]|uniref:Uncharacterized protein n=1 Tax=Saccharopolyspora thermophila TaxID=89367 RepID=A0ABP3LRV1_9PSEU
MPAGRDAPGLTPELAAAVPPGTPFANPASSFALINNRQLPGARSVHAVLAFHEIYRARPILLLLTFEPDTLMDGRLRDLYERLREFGAWYASFSPAARQRFNELENQLRHASLREFQEWVRRMEPHDRAVLASRFADPQATLRDLLPSWEDRVAIARERLKSSPKNTGWLFRRRRCPSRCATTA